jgi:hypothetical protein
MSSSLKACSPLSNPTSMERRASGELAQAGPRYKDKSTSTTELLYTYKPLQRNEIRLLYFAQKTQYNAIHDPSAPVELLTKVVDLDEAKPGEDSGYCALSYTWGDEKPDRLILLDGKCFSVTPNLESALRELWKKKLDPLWIDAICIDQDETNPEKNGQVAKMGKIYANAIAVIIWLGKETFRSMVAIEFIEENFEVGRRIGHAICNLTEMAIKDSENIFAWVALGQDLLRRPWWRRMW